MKPKDNSTTKRPPDDPEQSKRFIETAEKIGTAKTKKEADEAFRKVLERKPRSGD